MRRIEEVAHCTHLVLENRVVRTEKLLCAMAYGVPVVTRRWIIDSITQRKVLREHLATQSHFLYLRPPPATDNYRLTKDLEFKKTVGCEIGEALRRAKVTGRTLFKGHMFYISKQTKLNFPLLEKVIKAAGGQVDTCALMATSFKMTFCIFFRPTIRSHPSVLLRTIPTIGTLSAVKKTRMAGNRLPHKGFRYTSTSLLSSRYCVSSLIPQAQNFKSQPTRRVRAELVQSDVTCVFCIFLCQVLLCRMD